MTEREVTALLVRMKLEGKTILWGDGIHDDTDSYQNWLLYKPVYKPNGELHQDVIQDLVIRIPRLNDEVIADLNRITSKTDRYRPGCSFCNKPIKS